jgi:hypothetical protein
VSDSLTRQKQEEGKIETLSVIPTDKQAGQMVSVWNWEDGKKMDGRLSVAKSEVEFSCKEVFFGWDWLIMIIEFDPSNPIHQTELSQRTHLDSQ